MVCLFKKLIGVVLTSFLLSLMISILPVNRGVLHSASFANSSSQNQAAQLRYLSFAITAAPPSEEDFSFLKNGSKSLSEIVESWIDTGKERPLLRRIAHDFFGTQDFGITEQAGLELYRQENGALNLIDKAACTLSQSSQASAWWLDSGETDLFCDAVLENQIEFGTPNTGSHHVCTWPSAQTDARCGCGTNQIICFPKEKNALLSQQLKNEFSERFLYVYDNDLSIADLFGGDFQVSTKLVYHLYLFFNVMQPSSKLPTATELAKLAELSVSEWSQVAFPTEGPKRGPVVTHPNFLLQHNNFRSRVSVLVEKLLCLGVGSSLNTDNISSFVNTDLSAADVSHGQKQSCSSCHYPMDNMGSTLLQWGSNGYVSKELSDAGHSFGQTGNGALFLMDSFVKRGPNFSQCMAKTFYETITRAAWNDVTLSRKTAFQNATSSSLKAFVRSFALSPELLQIAN